MVGLEARAFDFHMCAPVVMAVFGVRQPRIPHRMAGRGP